MRNTLLRLPGAGDSNRRPPKIPTAAKRSAEEKVALTVGQLECLLAPHGKVRLALMLSCGASLSNGPINTGVSSS